MAKKEYQKIELPINITESTPTRPDIKWAWIMIGTTVWFLVFTFWVFHLFSNFVVWNISIEQEKQIFWDSIIDTKGLKKFDTQYTLSKTLPELDGYDIYLSEEAQENAFTVVWWNIFITRSLISKTQYEEEVLFVLAHELWHVISRHSIKRLARDLPFKISLLFLWFDIDLWITNVGDVVTNSFSREAERDADTFAIETLKKNWLNPYCASEFFDHRHDGALEYMSTHPTNDERIDNIKNAWTWKTDFSDCTIRKKEKN